MHGGLDGLQRRHARSLRAGVTAGGLALVLAGVLAAADGAFGVGGLAPAWSAVLAGAGAVLIVPAVMTSGEGSPGNDLVLIGAALVLGGVAEFLHGISVVESGLLHFLLAASLAAAAAVLLTMKRGEFSPEELRVVHALRVTGTIFALAAAVRLFVVWIDGAHELAGGVSMLLMVLAGIGLLRTARSTPPSAWRELCKGGALGIRVE